MITLSGDNAERLSLAKISSEQKTERFPLVDGEFRHEVEPDCLGSMARFLTARSPSAGPAYMRIEFTRAVSESTHSGQAARS
jgi:hypothetical protein